MVRRDPPESGFRRLSALLPGSLTSALNQRADESFRLRQAWVEAVPEPLASHSNPVRYAAGLLFVNVDTPAWASRLRHQHSSLISALRRHPMLRDLADMRVRVAPAGAEHFAPPVERPRSRLSAQAAVTIKSCASGITHPDLRAALERLAERGGSPAKAKA